MIGYYVNGYWSINGLRVMGIEITYWMWVWIVTTGMDIELDLCNDMLMGMDG